MISKKVIIISFITITSNTFFKIKLVNQQPPENNGNYKLSGPPEGNIIEDKK